jgi:hypothetical protein
MIKLVKKSKTINIWRQREYNIYFLQTLFVDVRQHKFMFMDVNK